MRKGADVPFFVVLRLTQCNKYPSAIILLPWP